MRYQCKFCYFKLNKGSTFKTFLCHIVTEHKTEENLFKMKINPRECQHACSNCNLRFVNENVLKYHELKMHKKLNVAQKRTMSKTPIQNDLKCQLCYAKFQTSTKRNAHVYNRHKKLPEEMKVLDMAMNGQPVSHLFHLKCRFCSKSFLNVRILKFHMANIHKEERKIEDWCCEYCKHVIMPSKNRSSLILKHMRNVHHIESGSSLDTQIIQPEEQTKKDGTQKNFDLIMKKLLGSKK